MPARAGTYVANREVIQIVSFSSTFEVLASKQHPRKLQTRGSDGRDYPFLLKGPPFLDDRTRARREVA